MGNEQRRVVGYVRISKDRANETSTESQQKAIEAWAAAHGHQIVKVVVEPGRSAFKASRKSRPGFREASQLITSGAADMFAVWKVDRACRNTLDLLNLVEDLEQKGAEFASVTEQFDTSTPMGRAMMTIVGVLAELESAQKSDRATEWHRSRRLSGAVPSGPAGIGYRKPSPNTLEPDPVAAPLVREAAERIAAGGSVHGTAKWLRSQGVSVTHIGLKSALQSPTIAGLVAASDATPSRRGGVRVLDDVELVEGTWEPIVDRDLWERVRTVLSDPSRRHGPSHNALRWPLIPIVRCHCGSRMRHFNDSYPSKSAPGGRRTHGRLICLDQGCLCGIGYDAVEEAVTAAVLDLLDDDEWDAVRSRVREHVETDDVDEEAIKAKLSHMWDLVLAGRLDVDEYAEAKSLWMGERAVVTTDPADLPDVASVRDAWGDFTPDERALVFRAAIRRLVILPATRRGGRGVDLGRVDLELVA